MQLEIDKNEITKKYFWLKLKEDFFEEKYIRALRKLPDGDKLVITYLKMQLKSLKSEGVITHEHVLPNAIEELALYLDEDIRIVELTVGALIKMGVIEEWENNTLFLVAMQKLIGKETTSAERMRRMRANRNNVTPQLQEVTNSYTEIDIEKDINIELDNINTKKTKETIKVSKHTYGEYKNVMLKDEEFEKLKEEYSNYKDLITFLDEYIEMKGYKAKSHYLAIKKWVVNAVAETKRGGTYGTSNGNFKEAKLTEKDGKLYDNCGCEII